MTSSPTSATRRSYAAWASACRSSIISLAREALAAAALLDVRRLVEADVVELAERAPQRVEVPLLGEVLGGGRDVAGDDVVDEAAHLRLEVGALEHLAALAVDDLALPAHHVVVLEDVLAGLEVLRLDLALGVGDRAGDALVLDRHVVGDPHDLQDPVDPVGLEQPHQLVLERQVEAGLARVALAAGTTAQLVVDPARLVPLGADDVEAAEVADLVVLGCDLRLDALDQRPARRRRTRRAPRPGRGPACAGPGRRGSRPSRPA